MSTEGTIFSSSTNTPAADVFVAELLRAGWECVLMAGSSMETTDEQTRLGECNVIVWVPGAYSKDALVAALAEGRLDSDLIAGRLTSVSLCVDDDYELSNDVDEDEMEELAQQYGSTDCARMASAKTCYSTSVNYGCGPLAGDGFHAVNTALVSLTGGLLVLEF